MSASVSVTVYSGYGSTGARLTFTEPGKVELPAQWRNNIVSIENNVTVRIFDSPDYNGPYLDVVAGNHFSLSGWDRKTESMIIDPDEL
ncbi:hypothetical protein [Streptomyces xanthochromogenes]|uniref:hypothetical protein n=1 Tax=Streptomyces xanthochromogenes TaxID=67384 RepID=UPI00381F15CA